MARPQNEILESPLLAMGKRYVFYTSLLLEPSDKYKDLGKYAQQQINHFSSTLSISKENGAGSQIKEALNFLKNSAAYEREKEVRFFKYYETMYPEIKQLFNIEPGQVYNDYIGFIANINQAIKGAEIFKKELHSEISRIHENRAAADDYFRKSKDIKKLREQQEKEQYEKDMLIDKNIQSNNNIRFFFTANGDSAFKSAFYKNHGNMSILTRLIIEEYGARLFAWKKNGLILDERQKNALLAALTMKANELFVSDMSNKDLIPETKAKQIITSPNFKKIVDVLLDSPNLITMLNSLVDQYHMNHGEIEKISKKNIAITNIEKSLEAAYNKLSEEERNKINYDSWRKQINMTKDDIRKMVSAVNTIKVQSYYVSEDLSMIDLVLNGISAALGGGRNPTDDIQAGKLITTIEYDPKRLSTLDQQLWKRQERHFKRVGATSTYDSFMENTRELLQARKEQEELIEKFLSKVNDGSKGLNQLFKHINIHSTVKGYESAGSYAFEKKGGFGGAAFGASLDSELKIIDSMAQAGGLSPLDIDNLFIAMINCGKLMIGSQLKHTIENYFSAFMGMLMFNDAHLFATDVNNWIHTTTDQTTVEDLHMYQLNGVIVPSSYILQETYNAMTKLQTMDEHYRGIKAVFSTYNGQPINGNWEETSQIAVEHTKLERMHFLAGFIDLLDDIEARLNNLG